MKIGLRYIKGCETILEFDEKSEKLSYKVTALQADFRKRLKEAKNNVYLCAAKIIAEQLIISKMRNKYYTSHHHEDIFLDKIGKLDGSQGVKLLNSEFINISHIKIKKEKDFKQYLKITLNYLKYHITFKIKFGKKTERMIEDDNYVQVAKQLFLDCLNKMMIDKDLSLEDYYKSLVYQKINSNEIVHIYVHKRFKIKENNFKFFEPQIIIIK